MEQLILADIKRLSADRADFPRTDLIEDETMLTLKHQPSLYEE